MLYPLRRGQAEHAPAAGLRLVSSRSKWRFVQREVDIVSDPCGQVFCGEQVGFVLLPVLAPAVFKGILLTILRKSRNQVGVAGGDAFLLKCLGNFGNELEQGETGVDKALAFAGFLCEGGYVITGEVKKPLEALRLLIGVHVYSLAVLDQCHSRACSSVRETTRVGISESSASCAAR